VSLAETCDDAGLRRYARRQRGWNLSRSYQRDAAEAVFRESLDECRAAGDLAGEEAATRGLAGAAFGRCRFAESKTLYEQARELAKRAGNLSYEARSVGGLANVEWVFGHAGAALALYEQWMEMTAAGGDRRNHAFATSNLASALLDRGRLDEARSLFERVLATARDIGDRRMEADCMGYFGNIEWDRGRYGQAMRYHDRQLELCRELDDRTGQIYALINLNEIHRDLGEPEAARPLLDEADRIAQISANPRAACALKRQRGLLAFATGDLAAAEALLAEAVALSRSMNDRRGMTKGLVHLGDVLAARGRAEEARAALVEAAEGVMAIAADGVTAACRLATIPGGDPAAARAVFDEKLPHLALAARMECRFLLWMAAGDLRDLVAAKQDLDHLVAHAPEDCRESMLTNVRVNREIVAACKEQGIA
jgi:tetratricopeptide (TPR) repeat protein